MSKVWVLYSDTLDGLIMNAVTTSEKAAKAWADRPSNEVVSYHCQVFELNEIPEYEI